MSLFKHLTEATKKADYYAYHLDQKKKHEKSAKAYLETAGDHLFNNRSAKKHDQYYDAYAQHMKAAALHKHAQNAHDIDPLPGARSISRIAQRASDKTTKAYPHIEN